MGKFVRVVKASGVPAAIRSLKADHRAEAARHPDVLRYLQDHNPDAYRKVAKCRSKARVAVENGGDRYKVRLYGCHVEPWCIACEHEAKWRRVAQVLDRFQLCTPAGQQPRFAHIVVTAPIFPDGRGWGRFAKSDLKTMRDVIWSVTKWVYGAGIGAFTTYQDFGERAFTKTHPHLDFTLNGWMLQDGQPVQTPTYQLKSGGYDAWARQLRSEVLRRWLLPDEEAVSTMHVQSYVSGVKGYVRALAYQLRGLVDARKMTYDRTRQVVYWSSYRDNTRVKMTVQEFHAGLDDYERRLGAFGKRQSKRLHVAVGHMADRALDATSEAMGAEERRHPRSCVCAKCGDWEVVWPDEEGDYAFDPWAKPWEPGWPAIPQAEDVRVRA
jgi:hypothetical protein